MCHKSAVHADLIPERVLSLSWSLNVECVCWVTSCNSRKITDCINKNTNFLHVKNFFLFIKPNF